MSKKNKRNQTNLIKILMTKGNEEFNNTATLIR